LITLNHCFLLNLYIACFYTQLSKKNHMSSPVATD